MKKTIFVLLFAFAAAHYATNAHTAPSSSGSTTGWQDNTVNQSLAEEFARCAAFNDVAAACARITPQEDPEKSAARYEDTAKRFYRGSFMLAGENFTRKRVQSHEKSMRRNANSACEGFPKLEQQHGTRCDNTFKRLPRSLQ